MGVWHSSSITTSSFSTSFVVVVVVVPRSCFKVVLTVGTTVLMGVIGRNSSKISRPI